MTVMMACQNAFLEQMMARQNLALEQMMTRQTTTLTTLVTQLTTDSLRVTTDNTKEFSVTPAIPVICLLPRRYFKAQAPSHSGFLARVVYVVAVADWLAEFESIWL